MYTRWYVFVYKLMYVRRNTIIYYMDVNLELRKYTYMYVGGCERKYRALILPRFTLIRVPILIVH